MSNFSKDKGTRAETLVKDKLKELTGLKWERTPLSGALDPKHGIKADLYIPNEKNKYCVEVKHYADDHLTSALLTGKTPQLIEWWKQTVKQSIQVSQKPLLIFKFDRSKMFVAFEDLPTGAYRTMFINIDEYCFNVALLEDFLTHEKPKFI